MSNQKLFKDWEENNPDFQYNKLDFIRRMNKSSDYIRCTKIISFSNEEDIDEIILWFTSGSNESEIRIIELIIEQVYAHFSGNVQEEHSHCLCITNTSIEEVKYQVDKIINRLELLKEML